MEIAINRELQKIKTLPSVVEKQSKKEQNQKNIQEMSVGELKKAVISLVTKVFKPLKEIITSDEKASLRNEYEQIVKRFESLSSSSMKDGSTDQRALDGIQRSLDAIKTKISDILP